MSSNSNRNRAENMRENKTAGGYNIKLDQVSLSVNSLRGLCEFRAANNVRKIECVKRE